MSSAAARPPKRIHATLAVLAAQTAVLLAVYAPGVAGRFLYYDDYVYAHGDDDRGAAGWRAGVAQGRPLSGIVWEAIGRARVLPNEAWRWRLVFFGGLVAATVALSAALRAGGYPSSVAHLLAIAFATLPGLIAAATWLLCLLFPMALALAAVAARWTLTAIDDHRTRPSIPRLAGAGVCLAAALAIYQPIAMAFWPLVAAPIFRDIGAIPGGSWRRRILGPLLVGAAAVVAYTLAARALQLITAIPPDPRGGLEPHLLWKLGWFWESALPAALLLWHIEPRPPAPSVSLAFVLAVGALSWSVSIARTHRVLAATRSALTFLALAGGCAVLSFAPVLLVANAWSPYRTLVPLMMLVLLIAVEVMRRLSSLIGARAEFRTLVAASALLALVGPLVGGAALRERIVRPQTDELRFAIDALHAGAHVPPREVIAYAAGVPTGSAEGGVFDEFDARSSAWDWNLRPMVRAALLASGWDPSKVAIRSGDPNHLAPPDATIVDFRRLRRADSSP